MVTTRGFACALLAAALLAGTAGCQPSPRWPGALDVEPCPPQSQAIDVQDLADFSEANRCDYTGLELEFPDGFTATVEPIMVASGYGNSGKTNYYVLNIGSYGIIAGMREPSGPTQWFGHSALVKKVQEQHAGDPF